MKIVSICGRACARLAPLLLLACSLLAGPYFAPAPTASPPPPTGTPVPASATAAPLPTATLILPTQAPLPTPVPTADPNDVSLDASNVLVHPGPELYTGDRLSFEILAENPGAGPLSGLPITIYQDQLGGPVIAAGRYTVSGIARREQATFTWAWDTTGLSGEQTLVVAHDPASQVLAADPDLSNNVITMTVTLLPAEARPGAEAQARWARSDTECCVFNYLTGTAAERDLPQLEALAAREVRVVEEKLGVTLVEPLHFTLLSRLLGHGGFAAESIAISYLDRDFAGGDVAQVFRHETAHILDRQIAHTRPVIMTEGLAVYIAGGHFKVEDLEARAAAALELGLYIPLAELADDFYPSQHEIGYLEAGAFVQFLAEKHGWQAFRQFYGTFTNGPSDAAILDTALQLNFGQSLAEEEAAWLEHLRSLPADPAQIADVRDTVAFYETVRRYQEMYDPSAHYLTAWLPDAAQMRRQGIVADYLRHPSAPGNIALETMLVAAAAAIGRGDYEQAEWLTASANSVLDAAPASYGPPPEAFGDPLAAQYYRVVEATLAAGYEPQQISLDSGVAEVTAIREWPELSTVTLSDVGTGWVLNSD